MVLIDFHCHVLPGMDHGCDDLPMALAQLGLAEKHGMETLVATPHFYPQAEALDAFLLRREQAVGLLEGAYRGGVRLLPGAEVLACPHLEAMPGVERLCIEGTSTLLLEMPFPGSWPAELVCAAVALQRAGLRVVLAHAERYMRGEVEKLLEAGIVVQINASYRRTYRKRRDVKHYLAQGAVAALGSDIHGLGRHYRQYSAAVRRLGAYAPVVMAKAGQLIDVRTE